MRVAVAAIAVLVVAALIYFARRSRAPAGNVLSTSAGVQEVVVLELVERPRDGGDARWLDLTYADATGTTRFTLELHSLDPAPTAQSPFSMASGALHAVPGSRSAPLMNALAALHGGPAPERSIARQDVLAIDLGILAVGAAVNPRDWNIAGRYSTKEPGPCLVTKLFVPVPPGLREPDAEESCEIFLALDASRGVAELSAKDPDYWAPLSVALPPILEATVEGS
jgi:hypothetical protein